MKRKNINGIKKITNFNEFAEINFRKRYWVILDNESFDRDRIKGYF